MPGDGPLESLRVLVVRVTERQELREGPVGQRSEFGIHERLVGAGRAANRLGGVVDEDVEAARRGDVFGETDHLGGIAQLDADDLESVQPLRRVGETAEARSEERRVGEGWVSAWRTRGAP